MVCTSIVDLVWKILTYLTSIISLPSNSLQFVSFCIFWTVQYVREVTLCREDLTPPVSRLVGELWAEALGEVKERLIPPLNEITLDQVRGDVKIQFLWSQVSA